MAARRALSGAAAQFEDLEDPVARISAVSAVLAAVEEVLAVLAQLRIVAVHQLRADGWSLDRIARATGLSKARVAQIARDPRGQ